MLFTVVYRQFLITFLLYVKKLYEIIASKRNKSKVGYLLKIKNEISGILNDMWGWGKM